MMAAATGERPLDGALAARVWFASSPVFEIVLQNLSLHNTICSHDFRFKTRFIFGCNCICTLSKHLAGASGTKIPAPFPCVLTKRWGRGFEGAEIGGLKQKYWFMDWCCFLSLPHLQIESLPSNSITKRGKWDALKEKILTVKAFLYLLSPPPIYTHHWKYVFRENEGGEMGVKRIPLDGGILLTKNLTHWNKRIYKDDSAGVCRGPDE